MTTSRRDPPEHAAPAASPAARPKRRYEKPRLTDFGSVSKLTQTGGITTRDFSTMKRVCL